MCVRDRGTMEDTKDNVKILTRMYNIKCREESVCVYVRYRGSYLRRIHKICQDIDSYVQYEV